MRCLIRYLTRQGKEGLAHQDKELVTARLTIGRGADCDVFLSDLRVALEHATLTPSEDGCFLLRARAPSGFRMQHEVRSSAVVGVGSRIGIGGFELSVVEPPRGFDLCLDVEQVKSTRGKELEEALRARSRLRLADAGLSRRRWSWALFLAVITLFGVLPVAGFYAEPLRDLLRTAPLPSDGAWDPGPLAAPHRFIGADCNACHERAFVQTRDSACTACHQHTPHHVDPDFYAKIAATRSRCGACHKDHKGGVALVRRDEALCTDCHAGLKAVAPDTGLVDVSSFGTDHPEFRPTLLRVVDGETRKERLSLDRAGGLTEQSNLRFPHDVHLADAGLDTAAGETRVLQCGDCHVPEPGGMAMAPVAFEAHCHECHLLTFELDDPRREVPHGRPAELLEVLEEYYASRALRGGYPDVHAPEVVRRLRRPGVRLTPQERKEALEWVRETSVQVAGELFEYRACATCHTVSPVTMTEGPDARPAWEVRPVRVAASWMPKARFSHAKHRTMDCADCHDARASKSSEDVLIQGIATCRECHGGAGARGKLASTCVDCHGFHVSETFMMDAESRRAGEPRRQRAVRR